MPRQWFTGAIIMKKIVCEQIDYFICTAQSRTFFDAAEAMHISQSSLSKQIMKLEKELDKKSSAPRRTTPDTTSISITLTPLNTTRGS